MFSTVKGFFSKFSSELTLNDDQFNLSSVIAHIETISVSTKDRERDVYLIGESFFNSTSYPLMTFQSQKIIGTFDQFILEGLLTIRDKTQPVKIQGELTWLNSEKTKLKVKASGKVNRKDFGLSWNSLIETGGVLVGEFVNLEIEVCFEQSK
jgi:polyisoprenoid-binding protein YceI